MFLYKEANDMRTDIEQGSTRSHKYIKQQPGHERGATIAYETNRICDLRFRGLEQLFSDKTRICDLSVRGLQRPTATKTNFQLDSPRTSTTLWEKKRICNLRVRGLERLFSKKWSSPTWESADLNDFSWKPRICDLRVRGLGLLFMQWREPATWDSVDLNDFSCRNENLRLERPRWSTTCWKQRECTNTIFQKIWNARSACLKSGRVRLCFLMMTFKLQVGIPTRNFRYMPLYQIYICLATF